MRQLPERMIDPEFGSKWRCVVCDTVHEKQPAVLQLCSGVGTGAEKRLICGSCMGLFGLFPEETITFLKEVRERYEANSQEREASSDNGSGEKGRVFGDD